MSISKLIRHSRSSLCFGQTPSAFHQKIFSLFLKVAGRVCEGDELVDSGSWQFVDSDSDVRLCWRLVHFSHFQRLSRFEAFGQVLHFWWNPLEHPLHLTGTVLEHRAAEHLAHFSLGFLASARDKPWFKRDFNDGGVGHGGELSSGDDGWVVADVSSGDDSARLGWREHMPLKFLWGLRIRYLWLQGDKHDRKMGSPNGKLGQHNGWR